MSIESCENELKILTTAGSSSFSKRKSIDSLYRVVSGTEEAQTELRERVKHMVLGSMEFLDLLSDTVEKCRSLSVGILAEMAGLVVGSAEAAFLSHLFSSLETRMNQEDVEEVRLQIASLLLALVRASKDGDSGSRSKMNKFAAQVFGVVRAGLAETTANSAEIRETAAATVQLLTETMASQIIYHASVVIQPLVANLGHKYQKVRAEALEALTSLVLAGCVKVIDTIEPVVQSLATDNSQLLRAKLASCLSRCIVAQPTARQYLDKHVLFVLLGLANSEYQEVKTEAVKALNEVAVGTLDGLTYYLPIQDDVVERIKAESVGADEVSVACKYMIFHHSKPMLQYYYLNFHNNEFEEKVREFKVQFLAAFVAYQGALAVPYIDAIIQVITVREADNSPAVSKKVRAICTLLGGCIDHQVFIPRLIAIIKQETNFAILQSYFRILASYYQGMRSTPTPKATTPIQDILTTSFTYLNQIYRSPSNQQAMSEFIDYFFQFYSNHGSFDISEDTKLDVLLILHILSSPAQPNIGSLSQLILSSLAITSLTEHREPLVAHLAKKKITHSFKM